MGTKTKSGLVRLTAAILTGAVLMSFGCSSLFRKSPPARTAVPQYAHPTYPGLTQPKQKESKSWFGAEEPEKEKTVGEWMKHSKRQDL